MPLNTTGTVPRMPPFILFLAITWLALACLSSASVRFAVVPRDRAKSDLVNSSDSILDITFQSLVDNVVMSMVVVTLVSALFSIFGSVLVIYPKRLQEDCTTDSTPLAFKSL